MKRLTEKGGIVFFFSKSLTNSEDEWFSPVLYVLGSLTLLPLEDSSFYLWE